MDLKEERQLTIAPEAHWYYASKAAALLSFAGNIPEHILDVGAGDGFFSRYLLNHSAAKFAECVDPNYQTVGNEVINNKTLVKCRHIDHSDARLVLMMDVLEHVDDDVALLKDTISKVSGGTRFLLTVPAFNFLWSRHDDYLEHKRRYTLRQLENTVERSGLQVVKGAYFFASVFPIAAGLRLTEALFHPRRNPASQLKSHHPLVNSTLKKICLAERSWMRFNRLAGLSVFCLAQKIDDPK